MHGETSHTYPELLQGMTEEFIEETGKLAFEVKEVAIWAIKTGRWEPPADLILRKCCDDFSRALREEHVTDNDGRPVRARHVARIIKGETQQHLWAHIRTAEHEHIATSFTQRRTQIVGDCRHLNRDNKFYQSLYPQRPEIQLHWDFRDDVEEGEYSAEYPAHPEVPMAASS